MRYNLNITIAPLRRVVTLVAVILALASTTAAGAVTTRQLLEQCETARDKSQHDKLRDLSQQLLSQAQRSGDKRAEAYALLYRGQADLFGGRGKEALPSLNKAMNAAQALEADSLLAAVMNNMGVYYASVETNNYLAQSFFLKSLQRASAAGYENMRMRVQGNLLVLSNNTGDSTSLARAQEIYDYGVKHGNKEQTYMGTYFLAQGNFHAGNYKNALDYIDRAIKLYNEYPYDDIAYVYTLQSQILTAMALLPQAEQQARVAIDYALKLKQARVLPDCYLQLARVMRAKGEHEQSIDMARKALEAARVGNNSTMVIDCEKLLADNLIDTQRTSEATPHLLAAYNALRTLDSANSERIEHEQQVMQDMEQKEKESQMHAIESRNQSRIIALLVVVVLLLAGLLGVVAWNNRRRHRLYSNIVKQNTMAVSRQKELQQRVAKLTQELEQHVSESENETEPETRQYKIAEDKGQEIYDRLCMLMEQDRAYADPQLGRERLAEMLGTNRTYLSTIVKEKSGMSLVQFVNSYRINEAVRILSDRDNTNVPIKQLYEGLGFASPTTFYKLFQQQVGITPSVFRKQVLSSTPPSPTDDEE